MNIITLRKESDTNEIREYFNAILALSRKSNEFPVNLDDVWPLVYGQKSDAVSALKKNFMEGIDYQFLRQNPQNSHSGRPIDSYYLSLSCMEFFIARKVREVFNVYREVFHKVANRELSRKELALMVIQEEEEKERLLLENTSLKEDNERQQHVIEQKEEEINEMKPHAEYAKQILASPSTVKVTQIAQDYGMSAQKFNSILSEYGVQYKMGNQWILKSKYKDKGYVHSKSFSIHSEGKPDKVMMNTEWTQKGRLFLYELLKREGVVPMIEKGLFC